MPLFTIKLIDASQDFRAKIHTIKAVRELLGLSLPEAKAFVESAPVTVKKKNLTLAEAEAIELPLMKAGASTAKITQSGPEK
jgi:ribosomal protein L7/L12